MSNAALKEIGICDHQFPGMMVVPHKDTFVIATWCRRCGEGMFTTYVDDDLEGGEIESTHQLGS